MKAQLDTQVATHKMNIAEREASLREAGMQQDLQQKAVTAALDMRSKQVEGFLSAVASQQKVAHEVQAGRQKLMMKDVEHRQKMRHQTQQQKEKR